MLKFSEQDGSKSWPLASFENRFAYITIAHQIGDLCTEHERKTAQPAKDD